MDEFHRDIEAEMLNLLQSETNTEIDDRDEAELNMFEEAD